MTVNDNLKKTNTPGSAPTSHSEVVSDIKTKLTDNSFSCARPRRRIPTPPHLKDYDLS